ncbi:peroxiredoxin Q/BCP [Actinobaculum suis]|uniref:thioredoxin-dependent peroxiredoxin n=1 Tax=Actinobaculum suis TaxID=1657 RepID=A0A1G7D8S4_9ACTO|nr:peroxiredoxin [Actinobaculum suis]MDY5153307.1 peroxiredoxin [Actinobaculum suis]SDE47326.1 peroxiredoxin Q/BCP [Actinobaculum suis]
MSSTPATTSGRLTAGQEAPDFKLAGPDGEISLHSELEKLRAATTPAAGVILYFYPKAGTPGCTKQACDFRDNLNSLRAAGYTVVGISADSVAALAKFKEKQQLNFHLVSDPDHAVHTAYGTYGEKKIYGKTTVGTIRSTFVIDLAGKIRLAQYTVRATGHVARLRRDLGIDGAAAGADAA